MFPFRVMQAMKSFAVVFVTTAMKLLEQQRIPFEDDNQKYKSNCKSEGMAAELLDCVD